MESFHPIRASIEELGMTPNFSARDEHVPEIEWFIRTIKERVRGVQCMLPFTRLPAGRLTVELVTSKLFWWNSLPKLRGISQSMSPRVIVTGQELDFAKQVHLQFGEYVQTHEPADNDTSHPQTVGALALQPTGNSQGGHYFYSLKTGRVLNRT